MPYNNSSFTCKNYKNDGFLFCVDILINDKIWLCCLALNEFKGHERMMEIPGIGSILCATILAEVGDIKRFSSFNKFYAYTGLEPRRFETGDSVSRDKVSHEGSRHLRVVFYKNMQVIIKNNPEWYNYYKRKRSSKETCVAYGHLIKKVLKAIK